MSDTKLIQRGLRGQWLNSGRFNQLKLNAHQINAMRLINLSRGHTHTISHNLGILKIPRSLTETPTAPTDLRQISRSLKTRSVYSVPSTHRAPKKWRGVCARWRTEKYWPTLLAGPRSLPLLDCLTESGETNHRRITGTHRWICHSINTLFSKFAAVRIIYITFAV